MYCDYFGFKQEPFTIAPDPSFLYPSAKHRQALAHLKYGLDREGGFILLTGEVGTGKTTLIRLLLEQIPPAFRVAYILNAKLDTKDVLASICDELHIEMPAVDYAPSPKAYIDAINNSLLQSHAQGFKTLVVIEEAQNLGEEVLEMLRLLTNLETNTTKLLHILLVGQPELLDLIGRPQLRQLNQRVVSRFHLQPLDRSETESYLKHRLKKAGCSRTLFDSKSIRTLHRLSGGVPRKINLLGERALLGAYSQDCEKVNKSQVIKAEKEVFGDVGVQVNSSSRTSRSILLVVATLTFGVLASVYYSIEIGPRTNADITTDLPLEPLTMDTRLADIDPGERIAAQTESISEEVIEVVETGEQAIKGSRQPMAMLLSIWGIESEAADLEQLCIEAAANNIRCEVIENPDGSELRSVNRPALVLLAASSSSDQQYYLLEAMSDGGFQIAGADYEISLADAELEDRILGSAYYLWKPPLGFNDSVRLGESNWAVLNWLQPRLAAINTDLPELITGGRYSQPIRDGVAEFQAQNGLDSDGVLGRRTIMKFNEIDQQVPMLAPLNN